MFKKISIDNNINTVSSKKSFWHIVNESKNLLELISCKMNNIKPNDMPDTLVKAMTQIQKNIIELSKHLDSAAALLPGSKYYYDNTVSASMTIEYLSSNIYHYILSDDLPHIIHYDISTRTTTHYYDTTRIYSGYRKAVEDYMEKESFYQFEEKIFVAFVMFYEEKDILVDVDNKDIKPFLDAAISKIIVPDDNPNYVNVILLSVEGKKHTEVFAGGRKKVLSIIEDYL